MSVTYLILFLLQVLALSERRGITIGFYIILNNTDFDIFENKTIYVSDTTVSDGQRSYNVTGMKPFSSYNIGLQIFNNKGLANTGYTKSVKTAEGGSYL